MKGIFKHFIGIVTVIYISSVLAFGVLILVLISIPRMLPVNAVKKYITAISNEIGNAIVWFLKITLGFIHRPKWQIDYPANISTKSWYIGMSNHMSWADIFVLLFIGNYKLPLLKFFMKKELKWIPIIYLVHKTIDMPFLNRHKPGEAQNDPDLKARNFENARDAAKKFTRYPTTAFSFVEGTRYTETKNNIQLSPYDDLLKPKIGALVTAFSGMPMVEELIDFTIIYKTPKRSAWDFACGEMREAKIIIRSYKIPKFIKESDDMDSVKYKNQFRLFINDIWLEKQKLIKEQKY